MPLPLKEFYDAEVQTRDQLRGAVSIPIGLLSVLGTVLLAMVGKFASDSLALTWLFTTAIICSAYFVLRAAYYASRVIHGQQYARLPTALELVNYQRNVYEWETQYGNAIAAQKIAEAAVESHLQSVYATAADHNALKNNYKSDKLYRCNRAMVFAACLAAVAGIAFGVDRFGAEDNKTTVVVDVAPYLFREHVRDDRRQERPKQAASAAAAAPGAATHQNDSRRQPDKAAQANSVDRQ